MYQTFVGKICSSSSNFECINDDAKHRIILKISYSFTITGLKHNSYRSTDIGKFSKTFIVVFMISNIGTISNSIYHFKRLV